MARRHEAALALTGRGERRIIAAYKALSPEATRTTRGASVALSIGDGTLFLRFGADTIPALRALVNSYLRWLSMIEEILDIMEEST